VTVLEAIQRSSEFLARKGVDSPRLQAELLLAQVLRTSRMKLYLNFDRPISEANADSYRQFVQRRGKREPLQHIVGTVNFFGLELKVNRQVLIPRPETELLAERAVHWIKARNQAVSVLDFGTGSGCLAIAVASQCPLAVVDAADASAGALAVARENAAGHELTERIRFVEGPGLEALPDGSCYDLVVTNPPYVPTGEINSLMPEVRDYDPILALDGGPDGLDFYRVLAAGLGSRLKPQGVVMLEFGYGQASAIAELFSVPGWKAGDVIRDYSGCERIFIAQRID
jgi:release factor glutamine methyltransferase